MKTTLKSKPLATKLSKPSRTGKACLALAIFLGIPILLALGLDPGQAKQTSPGYRVLAPISQGNLTVFPIVADFTYDTGDFLTLDEGLRSGQVVVTEEGRVAGLRRPRPHPHPLPAEPQVLVNPDYPGPGVYSGAQVNRLVLVNGSDRPLILLAGEIVTGGKQDRVVAKDRIIPPKGDPIDLDVFCVEPHRWVETSDRFGVASGAAGGAAGGLFAQPSVRRKAMAEKNQQAVWDQVAQSRALAVRAAPAAAPEIESSSSYAGAVQSPAVMQKMDAIAKPIEQSYDKLLGELRAQKAVGAVVAVNDQIIWADAFASTSLLEKYWPKLIRSYAAEAVTTRVTPVDHKLKPSTREAQAFLDDFKARRESVESEPGIYRHTEIEGYGFEAFVLTSLLPGTGFDLHLAKMAD
ncbi:MAG: ARPP-1 family domain-containing protein [Terriglobia bacterium]